MATDTKEKRIRVCVRVRPFTKKEAVRASGKAAWTWHENTIYQQIFPALAPSRQPSAAPASGDDDAHASVDADAAAPASAAPPKSPRLPSSYTVDHLYGPTERTQQLYDESVREAIATAVEGYHSSVFVYGQTGTGKTYTMRGARGEPGVISLAVHDVFQHIASLPEREFLLRFSYLEVYNERVFDLLANGARPDVKLYEVEKPTAGGVSQDVVIKGVVEEIVVSADHLLSLVETGDVHRHTASTAANEQSSRSHTIFRLVIESQRARRPPGEGGSSNGSSSPTPGASLVRSSTLNLVDLAGSESVRLAHTTGQQQEEGRYINRSLLTLGHIIWKLSRGRSPSSSSSSPDNSGAAADGATPQPHLPYRNSKLTRLLQPALGGSAQITLVCTIAPSVECLAETHHTLKFASRARRVKSRLAVNDAAGESALLRKYRARLRELESQWKDLEQRRCDRLTAPRGGGGSGGHAELATLEARQLELQFAIENINRVILNSSLRQTPEAPPAVDAPGAVAVAPGDEQPYGVPTIETRPPESDGGGSNGSRANATLLSDRSGKSSPYLRPRQTLMSVLKAKYVNELCRLEEAEEGSRPNAAASQPEDEDDVGVLARSKKELLHEFVRGLDIAEAENDTRLSQIHELELENHHLRELLRQREDELEKLRRRA
ncbi:hypothetical protein P43SY_003287 [Pythium insidiosum]|uniref:Kinesin-like protein n=1 Tax=Pythium insidiosum TaxID=114742 RepID=A0AAD5LXG0_PYTIN|nr:hypothetical protein P43SY_003287 [Pythium insidiosum]